MGRHLRPRTRPNQSRRSALDTTVYNPIASNLVQYCVTASYRKRGAVPQVGELCHNMGSWTIPWVWTAASCWRCGPGALQEPRKPALNG